MAVKVASILAEIGLDSSKFTGGVQGVLRGLSDIKGSMKDLSVVGPLAAAAIIGLGKAAKDAIDDTVAYAKEVEDLSRLIGATPEEASRMVQAADDMRISYDTLASSMEVAIRKGFDPSIAGLEQLRQKYQDIQSPIERSKFLMDTFGRSGADMAPLLELSSQRLAELAAESDKAGLTMSGANLQAAKDYALAMDGLEDSINGAKIQMGNGLIPALTWFIDNGVAVNETIEAQNQGWIRFVPVIGAVKIALEWIAQAYLSLTGKTADSSKQLQGTSEQMKMAEGYAKRLTAAINGIPSRDITVTTHYVSVGGSTGGHEDTGIGGYANGGDFIVPAGYNHDNYLMGVQSGERVTVTPANEVGNGSTGGVSPQFFGPVTFVVKHESNLSEIMQDLSRM